MAAVASGSLTPSTPSADATVSSIPTVGVARLGVTAASTRTACSSRISTLARSSFATVPRIGVP